MGKCCKEPLWYFSELAGSMLNVAEQVKKEVNECLVKHGYPDLDEKRRSLLDGQISQVVDPKHPVHSVLSVYLTFLFFNKCKNQEFMIEICLFVV